MFDSALNTLLSRQLLSDLQGKLVLHTASDTFRILVYSKLYVFKYIQAYSRIFSIIKGYSHILRHCSGIFRLIQTYSAQFLTLAYIYNLAIFHALAYLEQEAYSKPCETLARYIQNFVIVRTVTTVCSGVIQPNSTIFRILRNAYISRNLAYSESWNIQNPSTIAC